MCMYVTELIGDDYKQWDNEKIILDCHTGAGKTYFVLHILAKYYRNKKFLYLVNRTALLEKIEKEKTSNVTVMTYQSLQELLRHDKLPPAYDFYIADEIHYITSDALMNDYTTIAYQYLLEINNATVVFMSATAKHIFNQMIEYKIVKKENYYSSPADFNHISQVYLYKGKYLIDCIREIRENNPEDKILIFTNNYKTFAAIKENFGSETTFVCSNSAHPSLKQMKSDFSLDKETFDTPILCATSTIYNGIGFKDAKIKYIFCEFVEPDLIIQAIGRKRPLSSYDSCKVYIKKPHPGIANKMISECIKELNKAQLLAEDKEAFKGLVESYKTTFNNNSIVYMSVFEDHYVVEIDETRLLAYAYRYNNLIKVQESGILGTLQELYPGSVFDKGKEIPSTPLRLEKLYLYLLDHQDYKYFIKKDKQLLLDEFIKAGASPHITGKVRLNHFLKENNLPFEIQSQRELSRYSENFTKTYWFISFTGSLVTKNCVFVKK